MSVMLDRIYARSSWYKFYVKKPKNLAVGSFPLFFWVSILFPGLFSESRACSLFSIPFSKRLDDGKATGFLAWLANRLVGPLLDEKMNFKVVREEESLVSMFYTGVEVRFIGRA